MLIIYIVYYYYLKRDRAVFSHTKITLLTLIKLQELNTTKSLVGASCRGLGDQFRRQVTKCRKGTSGLHTQTERKGTKAFLSVPLAYIQYSPPFCVLSQYSWLYFLGTLLQSTRWLPKLF